MTVKKQRRCQRALDRIPYHIKRIEKSIELFKDHRDLDFFEQKLQKTIQEMNTLKNKLNK